VTAESTPPESAHRTRSRPTFPRISSTAASMKDAMDQVGLASQRATKFWRIVFPCGVWTTSGWKWTA